MSSLFAKSSLTERRLLVALLVVFFLLTMLYNVMTPIFEASDEFWHYQLVRHLAVGNALPIQNPNNHGPWKQEGSQPPLYYFAAAASTFWIDTSNLDRVARFNHLGDFGLIQPEGNVNLVLHNRAAEAWPWQQTALAVHVARLLSILFSVGSVYLTYRIGLELFPTQGWLALAGAGAVAFLPMFVFISASVNNDSAAVFFSSLGLWLMLRIIRDTHRDTPTLRRALLLGLVLGLGALSKLSTLGLIGLAGLTLAYAALQRKRWQTFFIEGPLLFLVAALVSGWWFWRNWNLYRDPLGLNVFLDIVGRRSPPLSMPLAQLWTERVGFMWSYWGLFGGLGVPMPIWAYRTLNILALLSVAGIAIFLFKKARHGGFKIGDWAPFILSGLWLLIAVVSLVRWTTLTRASQGRLLFSAISVLQPWFIVGLVGSLPQRFGKWLAGGVLAFMASLTIAAPFIWIAPAYAPPEPLASVPDSSIAAFNRREETQSVLRLLDYDLSTQEVEPGNQLDIALLWLNEAPTPVDWSVFVHVVDESEIIIAQQDIYPGRGLLATSDLQAGFAWRDTYTVHIPTTAYAPNETTVRVGLYNIQTGERLLIDHSERDQLALPGVSITPPDGASVPNPVSFNFGDQLQLLGYRMNSRTLTPGQTLSVDYYWNALDVIDKNYTVFLHLVGEDAAVWGQVDAQPGNGQSPTSDWQPDELVQDQHTLTLRDELPAGIYQIEIGIYWVDDAGQINRLPRISESGQLVADFLLLSPIRVVNP